MKAIVFGCIFAMMSVSAFAVSYKNKVCCQIKGKNYEYFGGKSVTAYRWVAPNTCTVNDISGNSSIFIGGEHINNTMNFIVFSVKKDSPYKCQL